MGVRSLARCLRRGLPSLHNQCALTPSCRALSASSSVDVSVGPSTSAPEPQLPPTLGHYRSTHRAPRSLSIDALDRRLHSGDPDTEARAREATARDELLLQHVAKSRHLTPGQADTVRLLARSNVGLPYLRGQSILAKVLSVESVRIVVDTGYHGLAEVPRCDVSTTHIHTPDGAGPPPRDTSTDIRPGDLLRLRVDATYTPYGDMQLSAVQEDVEQRRRLVWDELRRRMEAKRPVKGRVLNECPGGYAVGIAGFTGLLPAAAAATATIRLVGVSQDFIISSMDDARRMLFLRDPSLQLRTEGRFPRGGGVRE